MAQRYRNQELNVLLPHVFFGSPATSNTQLLKESKKTASRTIQLQLGHLADAFIQSVTYIS